VLVHGLDWSTFKGSPEGLKWMRRDLPYLDRIIQRVPQKRVAVQAGACLGVYPKRLAAAFGVTYVFEPSAELFPLMVTNAPETNIVRFQAALGCDRALVGVSRQRRDGKPTNHEGITHIAGPGSIPTLCLDDLALPVCDLVYLDVEGYELYALQGAVETIARCRPLLAVEINKNAAFLGLSRDEVRAYITDVLQYRFVERLQSDEVYEPVEWTPRC
jgi:FkbM family methyltransferase